MTILHAECELRELCDQRGPYAHNIASIILRRVAAEYGIKAANRLVVSLKLKRRFGIDVVKVQRRPKAKAK